jgi:siderophore synthetase component
MVEARPEIAMRTVAVPIPDIVLKMPLGIKISTIIRTLDPLEAMMGQQVRALLPLIEQASSRFGGSLIMTREYAAAATTSEHLGCIIRESTEAQARRTGERIIVCATLAENIGALWHHSQYDKATLLRDYCSHFFRAVLGPLFHLGICLEAHLQNTLIRLDPQTRAIKGFVVRDLGLFMVHPPTFEAATGTKLELEVPRPRMLARNLEDVYSFFLSPVVIGHAFTMVRVLYPGIAGWRIVREELDKIIPAHNVLARQIWFERVETRTKAFMSHEFYGGHPTILTPNPLYHCQHLLNKPVSP